MTDLPRLQFRHYFRMQLLDGAVWGVRLTASMKGVCMGKLAGGGLRACHRSRPSATCPPLLSRRRGRRVGFASGECQAGSGEARGSYDYLYGDGQYLEGPSA
jgi:hypothetical protein